MVRQVKRVLLVMCALLITAGATCTAVMAKTYSAYDGNISTTYLTYFKDIIAGLPFNDNYVFFRSGQYEYTMVTGDIDYTGGVFSLNDSGTVYTMQSDNSYNGYYSYSVGVLDSLSFDPDDKIIYSDLGQFPQLEERGQRYEILQTVLIVVFLLSVVIGRIFSHRR